MKRITSIVFAIFLTCGFCESALAQMDRTEKKTYQPGHLKLTGEQMDDICDAAVLKVEELNEFIRKMASKRYRNRNKYIDPAKALFLEKCGPYDEVKFDERGNIIERKQNKGVSVELAWGRPSKFTLEERLMRVYFPRLVGFKYKSVDIITTDAVNMKVTRPEKMGLDKDGNMTYKCLVTYIQQFEYTTYENKTGGDRTTKIVECHITEIEILDINNQPDYTYDVKLGNIYVENLELIDPTRNVELIP